MLEWETKEKQRSEQTKQEIQRLNSPSELVKFYPVSFEDLGGYEAIKQQLINYGENNIRRFDEFLSLGFKRSRKHLFLSGPPSSGKTSMVLALMSYLQIPYVRVNLFDQRIFSQLNGPKLSSFLSKFLCQQPCVVVLEDMD